MLNVKGIEYKIIHILFCIFCVENESLYCRKYLQETDHSTPLSGTTFCQPIYNISYIQVEWPEMRSQTTFPSSFLSIIRQAPDQVWGDTDSYVGLRMDHLYVTVC